MRRKREPAAILSFILCSLFLAFPEECVGSGQQDTETSLDALIEKGKSLQSAGEFDNAAALFKKALGLSREIGAPNKEALCLSQLGIASWDLGQISESAKLFKDAYLLARQHRDLSVAEAYRKFIEITRLYNLGKEYRSKNLNKQSLDYFERAIAIGRTTGIDSFELKCLRQKSLTYWQIDDVKMFFECNKRGVDLSKKTNHRKETGRCLNNIGVYYEKTNDYSYALKYFEEALPVLRNEQDTECEAECLSNIGSVYKEVGDFNKALLRYFEALEIDKKTGDALAISTDLGNIGCVYLGSGWYNENNQDLSEALEKFNESLCLLKGNSTTPLRYFVENNVGSVFYLLGRYDQALLHYSSALAGSEGGNHLEERCYILSNIANTYFKIGKISDAISFYVRSLSLSSKIEYSVRLWDAYFGLGQCYEAKKDFLQALSYYKESISAIEKIRDRITLDTFKIGFAKSKLIVYQYAIDILYSIYCSSPSKALLEEIFLTVEKAKARAFLESIAEGRVDIGATSNPVIGNKEKAMSRDISNVYRKLSISNIKKEERERLLSDLEQKEEEYFMVMSGMKTENRKVASLVSPEVSGISAVQTRLLNKRTALLEYFVGDKRSYLFFVTNNRANLAALPSRSILENSLRAYLKVLSSPYSGPFIGVLAAERIARELALPLAENTEREIDTLIVIPDGILHYLPFETLRMDSGVSKGFLIEKYKVSYFPSASALLFLKQLKPIRRPLKSLLAIGAPIYKEQREQGISQEKTPAEMWREIYLRDGFSFAPLPFSKNEVLDISSNFPPGEADIFLDADASEALAKRLPLREYQIIHFACHGFLDEKSPFRSALVLSIDKGQEEDGFLQVREINNLRINADLVVLSACQTGNGPLEKGEGLLGLNRTFFQAGARAVLSSLWPINDQTTAAFMGDFYRFLVQGQDKNCALRQAKIKMLRSSRSHPFYWAGFILHGDSASILFNRRKNGRPN
jgi:CHAT domain-containing protein/tetratricopeptide (TPR) repeat protein